MTEIEQLQKKIIEMQDGEIGRLRLEVSQLKFELSKLQSAPVPPSGGSIITIPAMPTSPTDVITPWWGLYPPNVVGIPVDPPHWTITCDTTSDGPILKATKVEK